MWTILARTQRTVSESKSKNSRRKATKKPASVKKPELALSGVDGADGKTAITALDERFANARSKLNTRRQRLIRAILDSADETCFLSSREMAKRRSEERRVG